MRPIDADEVIAALHETAEGRTNEARKILLAAALVVHFATTIDLKEPSATGYWIDCSPEVPRWSKSFRCSECGGFVDDNRFNFCPRCGAKMEV